MSVWENTERLGKCVHVCVYVKQRWEGGEKERERYFWYSTCSEINHLLLLLSTKIYVRSVPKKYVRLIKIKCQEYW